VNVATHVNGTVDHTPATGCTQCHGDLTASGVANTDVRAAPASNANAVDAHGDPATATGARGVGAHAGHLTGTTWRSAPIACRECHAVPAANDTSHITGTPVVAFGALARTAWSGQPAINPVWNGAGGAADLTCSSTYCHGAFPGGNSAAPTWATPSAVGCGSCHGIPPQFQTDGVTPHPANSACGACHGGSYTSSTVDKALHMNGKLDGGGESAGGAACGGCHGAIFSAMNGGVTHATKHTLGATAGTNDSPTDSGVTWANPLSSNAAAARSCVNMCHGDHPHDLVSPATATDENNAYLDAATSGARADGTANRIGVGGTGGTPNRMKTDYDGTQANGGLCASCHLNPIDAGHPAIGKATFDASAHDYTSNTVGTSTWSWSYQLHDGSLFVRDCTKCHASNVEGTTPQAAANGSGTVAVHFSDNASLLSGATNPSGTAAGFVCYNCHGSTASPAAGAQGNRSGKDIQSQIAHATTAGQSGHPAISDLVHNSVAEHANATFGNALGVAAGTGQRHASCLDCHDPHQAKAGTHAVTTNVAGPPLQGAWGASLSSNPAFWTAPTSANFLKTTIVAGTDLEATLCFKCHSAYYGTLPTSPSSVGLPAPLAAGFAETDQAMEFNPANAGNWSPTWASGENAGSFHPVLADCSGNLGAINMANLVTTSFAWRTAGARNKMTCTDCHESDVNTDPNGPHGSAARFILKGPNTKWDATLQNNNGMPAGTFCANCHSQTFVSSRGQMHTNGHHNGSRGYCFMCHVAIPHGSMRPGLLSAQHGSTFDATLATDQAPYNQSPVTQGLGLARYPGTATTQWSQNYCGCGSASPH
jgi:predicted CxxxxCH...CXXCH cytochrome family protein